MRERLRKSSDEPCSLSVIIPAWNERRRLPQLLRLLMECEPVSEVIVADAQSEDDTALVAVQGGARLVVGGRPAKGRNAGAAAASEEILVFMDADISFESELLDIVAAKFQDNSVNLVHFVLTPRTDRWIVKACYTILDRYFLLCGRFQINLGLGALIAVRRRAFDSVGGFDESITAGEDSYFFRTVGRRVGGVVYCRTASVSVSARRFDLESPGLVIAKNMVWASLRVLGLRASIIPYRWERYD